MADSLANPQSTVRPSPRYLAQVKAFLSYIEDVEVDEETIEDTLTGLEDELDPSVASDGEQSGAEPGTPNRNGADNDPGEDEDEFAQEANNAWTEEEVRQIIQFLKQRGMKAFLTEYVVVRQIPITRLLYAFGISLCKELRQKQLKTQTYFLKVVIFQVLQRRQKLSQYNSIDDAADLIQKSRNILILTGAGISVSCGIPDFRSENGLYATLKEKNEYDLDDPQQMFDIQYFREKPNVFYAFARDIYPSRFIPSPCHRFIKLIEGKGKLLRNYTQNIDTLETAAGVKRVLQCHGSFATASCIQCRRKVIGTEIEEEILAGQVPLCKVCNPGDEDVVEGPKVSKQPPKASKKKRKNGGWDDDESEEDESDPPDYPPGIMKPDITFFGEKLTDDFDHALEEDRERVDLVLIIGTSLKVSPVAEAPGVVETILINKTPINHINPDIMLLGSADAIVQHLCLRLGWDLPLDPRQKGAVAQSTQTQAILGKRPSSSTDSTNEPENVVGPTRVEDSHVWLFAGADGGRWLREFERTLQRERDAQSSSRETTDGGDAQSRNLKKARVM
ncbi:SIR2-domain-containing protein [Thelephora ganbajun]|uniref:SIR2-domain-containing protein n=1 Tax=Thelephora ganbajun TaxID=370292 RepID=A0ACB6ZD25_THEGA|nr:SIR2-domain-containing protein [Thelephora ganbajun]